MGNHIICSKGQTNGGALVRLSFLLQVSLWKSKFMVFMSGGPGPSELQESKFNTHEMRIRLSIPRVWGFFVKHLVSKTHKI